MDHYCKNCKYFMLKLTLNEYDGVCDNETNPHITFTNFNGRCGLYEPKSAEQRSTTDCYD